VLCVNSANGSDLPSRKRVVLAKSPDQNCLLVKIWIHPDLTDQDQR
jgi:hypothetical protein